MHSSNLDIKYELKHSCPSANYTSSIEDQVDAYMYEGEQGLGMVQAGSAAIKLRKRQQHTDHLAACCQRTSLNLLTLFTISFCVRCRYRDPGLDGKRKVTRGGNSENRRQVTGVRFMKSMKPQVVEGSFGLCTCSIDCLFFFDLKYLFFVGCRDALHDTDDQDRNGYPYGNVGRYRYTSKRWTLVGAS